MAFIRIRQALLTVGVAVGFVAVVLAEDRLLYGFHPVQSGRRDEYREYQEAGLPGLQLPKADPQWLARRLEEIGRRYGFVVHDGAIVRDDAGDPLQRDSDIVQLDVELWQQEVQELADQWYDGWLQAASREMRDFLSSLDPLRREVLRDAVEHSFDEHARRVRTEQDRLTVHARQAFHALRLRDTWSLRRKTEAQTAGEIAARLTRETDEAIGRSVGDGDGFDHEVMTPARLVVEMERWEESFRSGFERGLEEWNAAERRLLEERFRWESGVQSAYFNGEQAWDSAVAELADTRADWMDGMVTLFDAGRRQWDEILTGFDDSCAQMMTDLTIAADAESESFAAVLDSNLAAAAQAQDARALARSGMRFLQEERTRLLLAPGDDTESAVAYIDEQLDFWNHLVDDAERRIHAAEAAIRGLEDEMRQRFPSTALDPVAREIAHLEARFALLDHRVAIAEAVTAYAADRSAGRDTESRTRARHTDASAALFTAQQSFDQQAAEIERLSRLLAATHADLRGMSAAVEKSRREVDAARQRYESRWEVWYVADATVMERTVQSLEDTVQRWESTGRLEALREVLRYGEGLRRAAASQEAEDIVAAILDGEAGRPSQLRVAQSRSVTADTIELVFDSSSDVADLGFCLAAAGFERSEPHVERLLESYAESLSHPDDDLLREAVDAALRALRESAAEELFRLELILQLLQEPGTGQVMSHDEHRDRLLADAETDGKRLVILEVHEDLLDVVPAWADSVRIDVARSVLDILELPGIEEDSELMLHRLQQLEDIPFPLHWAIEVVLAAPTAGSGAGEAGQPVAFSREMPALLAEVVALLHEQRPAGDAPSWDQFVAMQARVIESEREVSEARIRIKDLERDLLTWRQNRDDYFDAEVRPAEAEYARAQEELKAIRQLYRRSFDVADDVARSIEEGNRELHQRNRSLVAARREMQLAQELLDYASGGYELATNNPLEVLRIRREERDRLSDALNVVRSLVAADSWDSLESIDVEFLSTVETRYELYEARNYLGAAAELIASLERDLQLRAGTASRAAGHAVRSVISASQSPLPDPDISAPADTVLPNFGSLSIEAYIDAAGDYFLSSDPAQRQQRCNETAVWMISLANSDDALLKDFGLAYYYEQQLGRFQGTAAVEVRHAAGTNPNFVALVDDSRVRTNVESVLQDSGSRAYERLASDSERFQLYRFFTTIMVSDGAAFDRSSVLPFIEKDLARVAVVHVEAAALDAERRIRNSTGFVQKLFGSRPWRPVSRRRQQMPKFLEGGLHEREELLAAARAVRSAEQEVRAATESFSFDHDLFPGIDPLQQLAAVTGNHGFAGDSIGGAVAVLANLLSGSGEYAEVGNVADLSQLISGLGVAVDAELDRAEATHGALLVELAAARRFSQESFQRVVAKGPSDEATLMELTRELYTHPAFIVEGVRRLEYELAAGLRGFSEAGDLLRLERLASTVHGLYRTALDGWVEAEQRRLILEREELGLHAEDWRQVMIELHQVGSAEWQTAMNRLVSLRHEWRDSYEQEYLAADRHWNQRMEQFSEERNLWARQATAAAAVSGGTATAHALGLDAGVLIARVEQDAPLSTLKSLSPQVHMPQPGSGRLQQLMEHAEMRSARQAFERPVAVAAGMPVLRSGTEALRVAEQAAELIADSVYAGAALISALQLRRQVDEMQQEVEHSVVTANRSAAKGFADLLQAAGYTASGGEFRRRIVVDRSLLGGERRQTQRISAYQRFVAPDFDVGVDLSQESLSRLSGEGIQVRVEQAMENLRDYMTLVFGVENGHVPGAGFDQTFLARYERAVTQFATSAQYATHENLSGLFAFHIGYAPRMQSRNPERVAEQGYGETGRIMLQYYVFDARQERGIAMLEASAWDIPLWDSSSSPLNPPSLRGVASLGVSIAATLVGQPWMALAMSAANQSVFAALDIAVTGEDAASVWKAVGKNVAASAAATATGGVFAGFGEYGSGFLTEGLGGIHVGGSQLSSTWYGAASLGASNALATETVRAAIESRGSDLSGAFAAPAAAGYASAALSAGVSTGLSTRWQVDSREFSHLNIRTDFATDALSGLLGAATVEALRFGMQGRATINVLNVADIARLGGREWTTGSGAPLRHGLLEVSVGRGGVAEAQLGGSGVNVSYSAMADVSRSIDELFQLRRTQFDIDVAARVRDELLSAVDRALRTDEAHFTGVSSATDLLADELERIRRIRSRSNVDTLFRDPARRESYAESYIDSQLVTALAQGDVSTDHFLFGSHFDTAGSFAAAYLLYEQGRADAAALFNTEKAFAGDEYRNSATYEMRVELFLDYYHHDIRRAEEATSPAVFFGGLVVADAVGGPGGQTPNDPVFQGQRYVAQLVGENNLRSVGNSLTTIESLSEVFREGVASGISSDGASAYALKMQSLQSRGVFSQDNLYDVFTTGDSAARNAALTHTDATALVYRSAYRTLGGSRPDAAFTHYVAVGEEYYRLEVAYRDGVLRELHRDSIGAAEYLRVRDLVEGRATLTAQLAHHDGVQELYRSAGLESAYWRQHHELSATLEASTGYRGMDYFCNLHTNEYALAYGAPNLQNSGGIQRTANEIHRLLADGLANGNGRFVEVNRTMASTAGNNGMLVIASQPRVGASGHLAPVVGFNQDRDTPETPEVNTAGRVSGIMPQTAAFLPALPVRYYLWVPSY